MADLNLTAGTAGAPLAQCDAPGELAKLREENRNLRNAVEMMDAVAQDMLGSIGAISRLTLKALEAPEPEGMQHEIEVALGTIQYLSDTARDSINYSAEEVGAAFIDQGQSRRHIARCGQVAPAAAVGA